MAVSAPGTEIVPQAGADWHPLRRLAFRAAFLYWLAYTLPAPLTHLPGLNGLTAWYEKPWQALVPWVGRWLLGMPAVAADDVFGNGDTAFHYVRVFCCLVIAGLGALAWSLVARRKAYPSLADGLQTYLRYALSASMLVYGSVKVVPTQFPFPAPDRLIQAYGDSSPMALLWTFMGYSSAYVIFGGVLEVVGGLLILWRRTTTLGALLVAAVMANVVMLNLCYDVPVKLGAIHLLLMALYLLLPDAGRLAAVLVLNGPTVPRPMGPPPGSWLHRRGVGWAKALVVSGIVAVNLFFSAMSHQRHTARVPHAYFGIHDVVQLTGQPAGPDPLLGDVARWRQVVFDDEGALAVQDATGRQTHYATRHSKANTVMRLTGQGEPGGVVTLDVSRQADGTLTLRGRDLRRTLTVRLKQRPWPTVRLTQPRFRWIIDER